MYAIFLIRCLCNSETMNVFLKHYFKNNRVITKMMIELSILYVISGGKLRLIPNMGRI